PTDSVVVVDNGVPVDPSDIRLLHAGTVVERASGPWQGPRIDCTYNPNDTIEANRVVIELVRLTVNETGYAAETIGDYRYEHGRLQATPMQVQMASRRALVRSLLPKPPLASPRMHTGHHERIGVVWPQRATPPCCATRWSSSRRATPGPTRWASWRATPPASPSAPPAPPPLPTPPAPRG